MSDWNWKSAFKENLISAEDAAKFVKSGDSIAFTGGREAFAIGLAIAARVGDLKDVKIFLPSPTYDFGWYGEGWEESFKITIGMPTATCQEAIDAQRCDINTFTLVPMEVSAKEPDILITEISVPDKQGFCSFGNSLWDKKREIRKARMVIAEVNNNLIRTYGDNFIHVSEIDYLVEHISSGAMPGSGSLAGRALKEPEPYLKDIAGYVGELILDRATIQIGVGRTTEPLVRLGMLDGKKDIGYHSEATPNGIISLIREGVINGKYKNINTDRATVTSLGGGTKEEMEWARENPTFQLVDVAYLENLRIIGDHDNMTSINNALMVDLTGQIAAETIGTRIMSLAGGQIPFVFGSWLSNNGRSITVIRSTAKNNQISRIVPLFPQGTIVTIQRNLADYIVSEYGIAHLRGKSIRERVGEMISIAHPDHRDYLWEEAKKLYWPKK